MKKNLLKLTALAFGLVLLVSPMAAEASVSSLSKPSVILYSTDPNW
ncbi:hypothetical protein NW801_22165 [Brevibacillus laterosporus]|uniref:ABC transporter substrate-binding protein n=1 Tax=Brevibacillus halotolerans TaxID=1507437 RepID=A0ABT4I308_9BACL|nr:MULTISPECIES: hypothetical protein [Brevibacillus]MCR8987699.1 hypothetical protein [Brevibacillus laterosporus]MCZ0833438.1 hypothetical protein [Brevibacillus halotolerans]